MRRFIGTFIAVACTGACLVSAVTPAGAVTSPDPGRTDTVAPALPKYNGPSDQAALYAWGVSDDGRFELFSTANASSFANAQQDGALLVRDMIGGYRLVGNGATNRDAGISQAAISGNGRMIAFVSTATNIDPDATGVGGYNLYVQDLTGSVGPHLASHLPGSTTAANAVVNEQLQLSGDGRYVLFAARTPRLDEGPAGETAAQTYYRYDTSTDTNESVSVADGGHTLATHDAVSGHMSTDGRWVAFASADPNLVVPANTGDATFEVYLRDIDADTTTLVSHAAGVTTQRTNGATTDVALSGDGSAVVYATLRPEAVFGTMPEEHPHQHVAAWSRSTNTNRLVDLAAGSAQPADGDASAVQVSATGAIVAFLTSADDLITGISDPNNANVGSIVGTVQDVYADVAGTMKLLSPSRSAANTTCDMGVIDLALSRDGSLATFRSTSRDLAGATTTASDEDLFGATTSAVAVRQLNLQGRTDVRFSGTSTVGAITPDGNQVFFTHAKATDDPGVRNVLRRRVLDPTGVDPPPTPKPLGQSTAPVPPGLSFHGITPVRVLDSRPTGPNKGPFATPWGPNTPRSFVVAGANGIPAGAGAVVLNVTATGTTGPGYLTIWPTGAPEPLASSLNWAPGATVPNAVTVKVGDAGMLSIYNAVGSADVIVDVVGYYDTVAGAGFTPLTPARLLDSRAAGGVGPWGEGTKRDVVVTAQGVPADADAVVLNATVTDTTTGGFLSVWPAGAIEPLVSSLNWAPGQTVANAVTVKVGQDGKVSIRNAVGSTAVILDVVGFFRSGSGQSFRPMTPVRIQDTRPPGIGSYASPWGATEQRTVPITASGDMPEGATSVLLNATVTDTTAASFATIWPSGSPASATSSLNWARGDTRANAVTIRLGEIDGDTGDIRFFNQAGTANVILDVAGWYG